MSGPASPTRGAAGGRSTGFRIGPRQIVAAVLVVLAIVFIAQNRDPASIDLFTLNVTAPLWIVLAAMVLVGLVIGLVLGRRRARR